MFKGWTGSNGSTASTSVSIVIGSTGNKNYTANWTTGPNCYMVTWKVADCWSETSGGSSQARPQAGFLIDVVDDSDDDAARWKISAYSYPDKAYKSCITCYIPRGSLSFYSAGPCPDQPTNYC